MLGLGLSKPSLKSRQEGKKKCSLDLLVKIAKSYDLQPIYMLAITTDHQDCLYLIKSVGGATGAGCLLTL